MTEVRIPQCRSSTKLVSLLEKGRPGRQVDKLVMLHMHIPATIQCYPPTCKKACENKFLRPSIPKTKGRETSRAPKRAEICESYTVLHL